MNLIGSGNLLFLSFVRSTWLPPCTLPWRSSLPRYSAARPCSLSICMVRAHFVVFMQTFHCRHLSLLLLLALDLGLTDADITALVPYLTTPSVCRLNAIFLQGERVLSSCRSQKFFCSSVCRSLLKVLFLPVVVVAVVGCSTSTVYYAIRTSTLRCFTLYRWQSC